MNKKNLFTENLYKSLLIRLAATIAISTVAFGIFMVIGFILYHTFTWKSNDFVYLVAQIVKYYFFVILAIVWLIDIIVVLRYYIQKTSGYLDAVVDASKHLVCDDDKIRLPEELGQIESQMNLIKLEATQNAYLAKEAEQRKNDLITYLAHDLKTPLTSVIGYLTLLHDEKQISPELRDRYLAIALDKSERLEDLINEFFDITRFSLSELTLDSSRVNLSRMIEQMAFEFKPLLDTKNLECELNIASDIEIMCDISKMARVFDNMIRNAINYSFNNSMIHIKLIKQDDCVLIIFINHGNTISKEKLDRIFEQFYRLDSSRGTKTGGAGLGLAISKEIVELHQGTIKANSHDELIEFEIVLPLRC